MGDMLTWAVSADLKFCISICLLMMLAMFVVARKHRSMDLDDQTRRSVAHRDAVVMVGLGTVLASSVALLLMMPGG